MVKRHTTGKNFDNLLNFGGKDAFIMENIGKIKKFIHFYITRFEAFSKQTCKQSNRSNRKVIDWSQF